jgi:hypothetical protein
MACYLTNRGKQLLVVPLNSGATIHLAPGESSSPIEDLEINGNEKVAKLLRTNLITATPIVSEEVPKEESGKLPPRSSRKR